MAKRKKVVVYRIFVGAHTEIKDGQTHDVPAHWRASGSIGKTNVITIADGEDEVLDRFVIAVKESRGIDIDLIIRNLY